MQTKIAVVGCGRWGQNIVKTLAHMGALAAICDKNPDLEQQQRVKALAKDLDVPLCNFETLLKDQRIHGVCIATPTASHFNLAQAVLKSKKHVFVEKPLVLCPAENKKLISLSLNVKRTLMVGHVLRYHAAYVKMKNMLNEGVIGKIQHIESRRTNLGRFFPGESALRDLAPHDLSLILGITNDCPVEVDCREKVFFEEGVADMNHLTLHYSDYEVDMYFSRYAPVKEQRLVVTGTAGFLIFDDTKPWHEKLVHDGRYVSKNPLPLIHDGEHHALEIFQEFPLMQEMHAFIEAIEHGKETESTGEDAYKVLKIMRAAEEAALKRTAIKL